MRSRGVGVALACLATSGLAQTGGVSRQLLGIEIQRDFVGKDFTDGVHWAIQHFRDGSVKSFAMGDADVGTWTLDGDRLCVTTGNASTSCHQIWQSGKDYQMRGDDGSVVLEGELVPHEKRG